MKGIKGFQKGHPAYAGTEQNRFKKGQKPWNDGISWIEMTGKNNPAYKTGRWFDKSTGYMRISVMGKTYWEHRYIMEQYLERGLDEGEHVHHLNHVRTDNRIENLIILTPSEHAKYHMTKERAIAGGHACKGIPKRRKGVVPNDQN